MSLSKVHTGEILILSETFLWGFFPLLCIFTYRFVPPIHTLAWSTFFAALFFGTLFFFQKKWQELKKRDVWKPILLAAFLIGIIYYAIFFLGMKYSTAGDTAIMAEMQVWFSFIFFGLVLRQEQYTKSAVAGAALMFLGALLVLFQGTLEVGIGELLILLAVAIPPAGNYFQQVARQKVSAVTLMFLRSILATPFLFLAAYFFEANQPNDFSAALPYLLLNGLLLFGFSKILWIEAIHRIPVAKANSLGTVQIFLTLAYAYFLFGEQPSFWQLAGLLPMAIGALLILNNNFLKNEVPD